MAGSIKGKGPCLTFDQERALFKFQNGKLEVTICIYQTSTTHTHTLQNSSGCVTGHGKRAHFAHYFKIDLLVFNGSVDLKQ